MAKKGYNPLTNATLEGEKGTFGIRLFPCLWEADPAAASTTAVHAAVTDDGTEQTITTSITNPGETDATPSSPNKVIARNVTATAGGTAGDIKAIQVTINGTNAAGETISEALPAFTVDTAGTVTGSKAFQTVTSIVIPAHDGTGATTAIGTGSALGLPHMLDAASHVLQASLDDTIEGTAPTVANSATVLESNTVTLDSALDGNTVRIYYLVEGND